MLVDQNGKCWLEGGSAHHLGREGRGGVTELSGSAVTGRVEGPLPGARGALLGALDLCPAPGPPPAPGACVVTGAHRCPLAGARPEGPESILRPLRVRSALNLNVSGC